jgi:hypothetical protein
MKTFRQSCVATLTVLGLAPGVVLAQASAPAAALPGASGPSMGRAAPGPLKPPPKLPTAQQKRDQAAESGDLRPDRPVTPQLNIPLGKGTSHKPQRTTGRPGTRPSSGGSGIDDSVARCNAESDPQARADCRAALPAPAAKKTSRP